MIMPIKKSFIPPNIICSSIFQLLFLNILVLFSSLPRLCGYGWVVLCRIQIGPCSSWCCVLTDPVSPPYGTRKPPPKQQQLKSLPVSSAIPLVLFFRQSCVPSISFSSS